MKRPETKELRRSLRTSGTKPEAILWKMLKKRQVAGLRFRRQHAVGPYVLDFYCPEAKLAIELDGYHHFTPEGQEHDQQRTEFINRATGIHILRFENQVVFDNPEMILGAIEEYVGQWAAQPSPPLQGGGGSACADGGGLKTLCSPHQPPPPGKPGTSPLQGRTVCSKQNHQPIKNIKS